MLQVRAPGRKSGRHIGSDKAGQFWCLLLPLQGEEDPRWLEMGQCHLVQPQVPSQPGPCAVPRAEMPAAAACSRALGFRAAGRGCHRTYLTPGQGV